MNRVPSGLSTRLQRSEEAAVWLRDVDLRWWRDDPSPESFQKSLPVEYLFYRELRALKIETPGIAKINVYCVPKPRPYAGNVHEGVTDVDVKLDWDAVERLPPDRMVEVYLSLLTKGVVKVLKHFDLPTDSVEEIEAGLRERGVEQPISLSKTVAWSPGRKFGARLFVRAAPSLEHLLVYATISEGREELGEVPICTTHPVFDFAVEAFKSLSWVGGTCLRVDFVKYGVLDRLVFGRYKFDSRGFGNVVRKSVKSPRELIIFEADVSSVTAAAGPASGK